MLNCNHVQARTAGLRVERKTSIDKEMVEIEFTREGLRINCGCTQGTILKMANPPRYIPKMPPKMPRGPANNTV